MSVDTPIEGFTSDVEAVRRLRDIVMMFLRGRLGAPTEYEAFDFEYGALRKALLASPTYRTLVPKIIRETKHLRLLPERKNHSDFSRQFDKIVSVSKQLSPEFSSETIVDSKDWTGASTGSERIRVVQDLLPIAQFAIESLIESLETPQHNGGPPLDETTTALEHLRELHAALGKMLVAADDGKLMGRVFDGLAAEAARYGRRALDALRHDPLPFAVSASVIGLMSACGIPDVGGYLAGVALAIKRR